MIKKTNLFVTLSCLTILSACSGKVERNYDDYHPGTSEDKREAKMSSLVTKSKDPIVIFGGKKTSGGANAASGIASSYLWRASLESIAFMPLIASDSNGGAILTDWYSSPQAPNEKFKFNIIILSSELNISSIKVTAFKQVFHAGHWKPVEANKELSTDIEEAILKKAIALKATSK